MEEQKANYTIENDAYQAKKKELEDDLDKKHKEALEKDPNVAKPKLNLPKPSSKMV